MPDLTLVSFNAHYGMQAGVRHGSPYDLAATLTSFHEPDVLVVQEVWRPDAAPAVVDEFAAAAGYARHDLVLARATVRRRWPHADAAGEGTFGLSVLTRRPATVVSTPTVGPTLGDPVPRRRVLHLVLDVDGRPVDLVAVHLTSRLPHGPPLQLRRLARALPATDRPGILVGDCNFWGPPASALLPGWRRTVRGRTWPAHRPHSQIDHVFVRGSITATATEVLRPDASGSDHRAVRVVLRVPERIR